ncbi:MAG: hypothetical protein Q4D23_03370 [Bacteroidales bacterium]|nr:hypothetical protein [Bacteroidales bacterium]
MKKILFLFVAAFVCALGANAEVWKKVTSAPADWSGKYLIACDNGEDWAVLNDSLSGDHNTGNLQSSFNYKPYDVNADGNIELDACDYYVTIAKKGDAYTICTASGWYIGNNADSNALGTTDNAELAFLSTISLSADQGAIITAVEGGSVLRYNHASGQDRFRYYKASTYTNQQKIALYKLEEAAPVVPEVNGYVAATTEAQLKAGQEIIILNRYGWGAGTWRTSDYMWYHNEEMDKAEVANDPIFVYDGDVNVSGCPTSFLLEDAGEGAFYLKDLATGNYLNGAYSLSQSSVPSTPWIINGTDADKRQFEVYYMYNGSKRYLAYGSWLSGGPLIAAANAQEQPKRIFVKGGVNDQPSGSDWTGEVVYSIESISGLSDLEGLTLTFPGAKAIKVIEDEGVITIQNATGSVLYAVWGPSYGGTYEIKGNAVTLSGFYVHPQICQEIPEGTKAVYVEDYGTFNIDGKPVYLDSQAIAYNGAPVAQPFELAFRNNMVVCENGKKVEANEAAVGVDFYVVNEGLTAVGKTATLYKDGTAMSFIMTLIDGTSVSFLGGSSIMTEPGTYLLEVPAGTYVDAAGNTNAAYYGQWVIIQKDQPSYVEPVLKAEDVSAEVAYYIYTTARGGLTVQNANSTELVGTSEAGVYQSVDPTDVRQQFAFVNWEGNLYLYSVATQKFIGKSQRGTFTDEPVDPIYFKNASNGTVMLYFDNNFNINLGGSKQVTIDTWKTKDAGNSFIIKVAEPFDQTEIFERLNPKAWDRDLTNIGWSEANTLDDLLDVTVEFPGAASVEASGYDVLGVVFDSKGLPYAVALGNGVFDSFGTFSFNKSKANVKFQKIADLNASSQEAAKAALKKIGGFQPAAGEACVVFSAKSFIVDGLLLDELLVKNYVLSGEGTITGINGINVDANAQIFDLQGRRVNNAARGMYIINGVKVVR